MLATVRPWLLVLWAACAPASAPLEVVSVTPEADGPPAYPRQLSVTLDAPIDPTSVDQHTLQVRLLDASTVLQGHVQVDGATISLTLERRWPLGSSFEAELAAGVLEAVADGPARPREVDEAYRWTFTSMPPVGELDPAFGEGGFATFEGELPIVGLARCAVDSAHRVVCAGEDIVVRLLPDGRPDSSFGDNGTGHAVVDLDTTVLIVDREDRIVLGGDRAGTEVVRLTIDGQLDDSFAGGEGRVRTEPNADSITWLGQNPEGHYYIAGSDRGAGGIVSAFNEQGSLRRRFGPLNGGLRLEQDSVVDAAMVDDGLRLLVQDDGHVSVLALTWDGALDPSFGDGGSTPFEHDAEMQPRALTTHGEDLLFVGIEGLSLSQGARPFTARLLADGTWDLGHGEEGIAMVGVGNADLRDALMTAGGLVMSGEACFPPVCNGRGGLVVRTDSDGVHDVTYGGELGVRPIVRHDGFAVGVVPSITEGAGGYVFGLGSCAISGASEPCVIGLR